jgi:hypothetical protein
LLINNYANSSHIKEIVEKTRVLEHHVLGASRPLRSWRDIVLMVLIIVAISGIGFKLVGKYGGPWLIRYIRKKSGVDSSNVPTVSKQVPHSGVINDWAKEEFKAMVEQQSWVQNQKLDDMRHILKNSLPETKVPVRDGWLSNSIPTRRKKITCWVRSLSWLLFSG